MDSPKNGLRPDVSLEAARWRELAAKIRGVDPDAAQEWVERQWRAVWVLLRRRIGACATPDLARSALSEAVIEVRSGRMAEPADLTAWLRTFAGRFAPQRTLTGIGEDAARAGIPVTRLVDALRQSGQRERQALARYYLEGDTAERIGRELDFTDSELQELRLRMRALARRRPSDSEAGQRVRNAGVA
ncbi:MAG TPA: hypothetical protein VMN03_02050 [Burkholderiales bacterium]|nr:hypothetical protein [Burkholderiales bacterium]